MTRFSPVHLPDGAALNDRGSQTFLRHYDACPRSGFLYQTTRGTVRTPEMMRGSALHAVHERMVRTMIEQGEAVIPSEVLKVIVNEVLGDPQFAVPFEEHDYLRECAHRMAAETMIDPSAVVACETLFTLDVDGFMVRCRVDFAEMLEEGAVCHVQDFKSSRAAPGFEEVSRKRPDGSRAAKNFQLVLYALSLAFGVPVRVEECSTCADLPPGEPDEKGKIVRRINGDRWLCEACDNRGYIETPEPFPVASRAQRFDLEFVYPGIEDREGLMLRRPVSLTRVELDEYMESLRGLVARVRHSEESGGWPAVVSDSACGECPCPAECPIPAELRDHRGAVNTPEEAAEAFEKRYVEAKLQRAKGTELRKFVKAHGPVVFGEGKMVAEIGQRESEEIRDKDGMFEAQERAIRYGEPFDRAQWVKPKTAFPLVVRELTADELVESEGSNGSSD